MTITFNCEICGKSLSTSDDKAGRKAKCPGCGEMFTVPSQAESTANLTATGDDSASGFHQASPGNMRPCPMCGESIPESAERCEFCGEALESAAGQLRPRIIEFSDVFGTAWERFKDKMGTAVIANLVASIITVIGIIPVFGVFVTIMILAEQSGGDPNPLYFLWLIPAMVVATAVMLFITPGLTLLYLQLARGEDIDVGTGIGMIFSGGRFFVKTAICGMLFGLMVGFGLLALIIPGIILGLRYWPYLFVIVDEDPPGLECFSRSAELTKGNWGAILLIGISGMFLNIAAQAICGIITLFTQPFNSLLFATAYVKMTGKVR